MSQRKTTLATIVLAGLLLICDGVVATQAADLRLRSQATASGSLVLLGEIADIFASDTTEVERLSRIELFPAPVPGEKKFVRAVEIRDALAIRNENLADHFLSGASHLTIVGPVVAEVQSSQPRRPASAFVRREVDQRVAQLIADHLAERHPDSAPWLVEPQLIESDIVALESAVAISVTGYQAAQDGPPRFFLEVSTPQRAERLAVFAEAEPRPAVVVASRRLPPGSLIDVSDVTLEPAPDDRAGESAFRRIEDVVGRETTRALIIGQVLSEDLVRHPILVHRRDVVTVYARNGGVRIRTTGRAKDEGSLGELVAIESPADRKTFFARVSGFQEVEVFARAPRAGTSPPASDADSQIATFSSRLRQASARGNAPQSIGGRTPARTAGSNRPSRLESRSIPSQASRGR